MRFFLLLSALHLGAVPAAAQYEASLVMDIYPGPEGSIIPSVPDRDYFSPIVYDGRLFFSASDGQAGLELWFHDAATGETALAADIQPGPDGSGPTDFAVYDGRLFFAAFKDGVGRELWVYDASTGEAALAADINTSSDFPASPQYLTVFDGRLFFNAFAPTHGNQLWVYNAATEEATVAATIDEFWSWPFHLTVYDDRLFFSADNGDVGRELWVYDAVTDETTLAIDLVPGPSRSLGDDLFDRPAVYDDRLFLITYLGQDLWSYDASTNTATFVTEGYGSWLIVYDERLFSNGGGGLRVYDASTEEVSTVADVGGAFLTVYDDKLFFSAGEVWNYDADIGEASLIADINPDDSSSPEGFIVYDGRLFFNVDDGTHGRELWVLTPTPVANEPSVTPQPAHLHTPHPNPAQDRASITFDVDEAGPVRVEVFDVLGRSVALLADGPVAAGEHTLTWDAGTLPSGLYLIRLTADDAVHTQRLTLAR